ncbi:type II secretion system F family protein [Actinocorallia aurantiaca]|uniref:Type II secretion system F family protein n=1 Tax=Actinocorallia aurantiaca TaxID=46204 RepID=A0ABN3U9V0_9ACTN
MGAGLLYGGLAGVFLGSVLLVLTLAPGRGDEKDGVAGAVRSIEHDYTGHGRPLAEGGAESSLMRRFRSLALRLSPAGVVGAMQERLDRAGNPGGWSPERLLSFKGFGLVAGAAVGLLFMLRAPGYGPLLVPGFGAAGFFVPDVLLYNQGLRRQEDIGQTLPDVLDLLVVSVESGLGFDAALARVGQNTRGPLSAELVRVMQEVQIGKSREEALRAMSHRSSVPELRTFVGALVQASDLGIPIGKVLREQAGEMRVKRRQRAEERAQKLAVKITIPVVFCLFPAIFLVLLGPGIIAYLSGSGLR